ncbi:hypothetical protein Cch01nite_39830 [Cellulomonas chitinilytica]|uniref:Uncharacterized protein n=1 Tax=Cellulomonas chitinilytica TaxID=398759 RepID=A0A919U4L2_9CELL|nr:hypothetical protein [Cellulomonas chitinilytica]GIG23259.1 hypothetical protein Cch01nite_39830 [Cellulomonas chitinilytica]
MHPDLAMALYVREEHDLELRLERRRSSLESYGRRMPRPHRMPSFHLHHVAASERR